jgi:hypothetical protein
MTIDDIGAIVRKDNSKRVLRFPRLSDEELALLKQTAQKLKVTYDGQPTIPGLIKEIARGRLVVTNALELSENHDAVSHNSLVDLDIEVISDANGVMVLIAKKICDVQGNIFYAHADGKRPKKNISIGLAIDEELHLVNLIKMIKSIKFSDISKFNNSEQLVRLAIDLNQHYSDLGTDE